MNTFEYIKRLINSFVVLKVHEKRAFNLEEMFMFCCEMLFFSNIAQSEIFLTLEYQWDVL